VSNHFLIINNMAVNRYDQPAQAQFINTYVPIPFQEMLAAGQQKMGRYDKAAQAMDSTIAAAEQIPAIPFSDDERRAKEYVGNLTKVRDEFVGKDLSDPFVVREMSNKLRTAIDPEDIKHIQESYQGWVGYNKQLAENEQKGVPTPPELRQRFEGYSSRETGVYTGNAPVYQDPMKETSEFFKEIRPDTLSTQYEKIDGKETGRLYDVVGVSPGKLSKYAKDNMDAFLALPSVRQMVSVANKRGDNRKPEEIAMDYVNSNASKWTYHGKENVAFDPNWKQSGGSDTNPGEIPSIHRTYGIDSESSKSVGKRKANNEIQTQEQYVKDNPNDVGAANKLKSIKAEQETAINTPQEGERVSPVQKVQILNDQADVNTQMAIDKLMSTGMTKEKATEYLITNSDAMKPGSTSLYSQGRILDVADKLGGIGSVLNKAILMNPVMLAMQFPNKEDIPAKEAYKKRMKEYIDTKREESLRGTLDPTQVLTEYSDLQREHDSKLKKLNNEIEQVKVDAYNKSKVNQSTYTVVNSMFEHDKTSGIINGKFIDSKGVEKKYPSYIAEDITNYIYNPNDYQSKFFKENGKVFSKADVNDIRKLLNTTKDFRITQIDDEPGKTGGAVVTVNMMKDAAQFGEKFKVEIPLSRPEDLRNFSQELTGRGQASTAFQFTNKPIIKAAVENTPVFDGGVIPLSRLGASNATEQDNISFEKSGAGFVPILNYNGESKPMTDHPVSYNNLASAISDYLESVRGTQPKQK
jgi:hypothetical protein